HARSRRVGKGASAPCPPLRPAGGHTALCPPDNPRLRRNLPERLPYSHHAAPDQPRILHRRLAVLDRFAIDGIADHLDESADARIFGDEAMVPALVLGTDQHQLEPALPDDPAAEAGEHRTRLPAIGRIGLPA